MSKIANYFNYFKNEVSNPCDTPAKAFTRKTTEATGINARTIRRIKMNN